MCQRSSSRTTSDLKVDLVRSRIQMNQPDEGTAVGRLHAKAIKLVFIQMTSRLSPIPLR